jgi:PAS domain-containing protein
VSLSRVGSKRLIAAALSAGVLGSSLAITGQQPEQTFVAVVRHDGSMIPIAGFDGHQWWNRWPSESHDGDFPPLPSTISSIPSDWLPPGMRLPVDWRLHTMDGRQVQIRALRPVRTFMLEPNQVIGLQSDYKWNAVPDGSDSAVAVSGPAIVGRFVEPSRQEFDGIEKQLSDRLRAIEEVEIARWIKETEKLSGPARNLRQVFRSPDEKRAAPFHLRRADRPFAGRTYYHLTGEKLYAGAKAGDDSCKMNMSFDGVVTTDRDGRIAFENVSAFAWAEYCGDAAQWSEPIATLQLRDQLVWVGVEHLEDGFSYFLMDPHTKDPLRLRRYPFVRVRLPFHDEGCTIPDLCQTLDAIRAAVKSRRFFDLTPHISTKATEPVGSGRNLITELDDPTAVAWPMLQRLLMLGGRVRRWASGPSFCAPGTYATWASSEDVQAFREGVEVDTLCVSRHSRGPWQAHAVVQRRHRPPLRLSALASGAASHPRACRLPLPSPQMRR